MKNYTIILFPEEKIAKAIEEFRMRTIGQTLVDGLPPHVTFKRRFTLNPKFSENDLINYFKMLNYKKFRVDNNETKI